jgi:hypothetical protein
MDFTAVMQAINGAEAAAAALGNANAAAGAAVLAFNGAMDALSAAALSAKLEVLPAAKAVK